MEVPREDVEEYSWREVVLSSLIPVVLVLELEWENFGELRWRPTPSTSSTSSPSDLSSSWDMEDEYEKFIRRMNPPRVVIDNEACNNATVIQVNDGDETSTLVILCPSIYYALHRLAEPEHHIYSGSITRDEFSHRQSLYMEEARRFDT